jgi:GDP-L-fucose synthase
MPGTINLPGSHHRRARARIFAQVNRGEKRMQWGKKKVIVTGGSGFLGQHVVARLRQAGCTNLFVPRSAQFDLTSAHDVRRLLVQQRADVIIHLAAVVGGIEANRLNPGSFAYKNLIMGAHLIEISREVGVEKFVMVGTICSYPKFTPVPFKESDLWNGYPEETNAPYGLAKKMVMVQLQAYNQQYGMKGISLLPVNLYGPGDNFDLTTSHVIPALIRKCVEARERGERVLTVWGTGTPTREFLYVADAARAIQMATEADNVPVDPVNVGSGQEIAIADLVKLIAARTGFRGEIHFDTSKPDGQPRRCLDVTRARELFGFEARTTLSEGLDRTIAWYEAARQRGNQLAA